MGEVWTEKKVKKEKEKEKKKKKIWTMLGFTENF